MKPVHNPSFFRSFCGLGCISRLSVEEQNITDYHRIWDNWAKEGAATEDRTQAVRLLKICLAFQEPALNLSLLRLRSLPYLPPHIQELNISSNELRSLPELPPSLTVLKASDNRLSRLPALPPHLVALDVSLNRVLTCLPSLPSSLQSLSALLN
ncbi:TPA: E3 ubiquitin--protein ligase, partial [Shigella flexneri]|nr:E3 ubiquitin--protein ligase [Shigella flexneri]